MQPFETLTVRGQLGRLRRLADDALAAYGLSSARLVPLTHVENTTFRVDVPGGQRYVLRIHRTTGSSFHPPRTTAEVWSEAIWLTALHRDTDLAVPEPVPTADGSMLTVAETEGVPTPRTCVLFRWGAGRFLDAGLTPRHLERVGGFIARLHDHALRFSPPAGFARWRIGEVSRGVTEYVAGLVRAQFGSHVALTVGSVLDTAHQAQRELGTGPEVFGLIHGDLHQENYLFDHGRVRAIDFDDSGWGHFTYDLAVVLSELRHREGYASLRAALLRGYRAVRPLSAEHERYLEIFYALRLLQLTVWCIEQRDHPGFAHWEEDARGGLAELGALQRTG